jgi:hypothetical protein
MSRVMLTTRDGFSSRLPGLVGETVGRLRGSTDARAALWSRGWMPVQPDLVTERVMREEIADERR